MSHSRVIYMEVDHRDGQFKNHTIASSNGTYSVGELFIFSSEDVPLEEYDVRAYHRESIYDERIRRVENGGDSNNGYVYVLKFQHKEVRALYSQIYFRAFPIGSRFSGKRFMWILYELIPTPAVLDHLEDVLEYNLVGDPF